VWPRCRRRTPGRILCELPFQVVPCLLLPLFFLLKGSDHGASTDRIARNPVNSFRGGFLVPVLMPSCGEDTYSYIRRDRRTVLPPPKK
jgi:hypothetical protein